MGRTQDLVTALLVALIIVGGIPAQAASLTADLRAALAKASPGTTLGVVVGFNASEVGYDLRREMVDERRTVRRREVVRRLRQSGEAAGASIVAAAHAASAQDVQLLWIANSVAMRASPAFIGELATDPRVTQIRLDETMLAPIAYAGVTLPAEWNINQIDAPALWARGIDGRGAVVASLDSGVDNRHPDLAASWRGGTNSWFDPNGQHPVPADISGHGTQAMGIMVGGAAGGTTVGVAPGAKWIAAKIFDDAGLTTESAVHRALQWVIDPDGNPATDDAPDVVNNSWDNSSEDTCNSVFQNDIDALRAADIAVVFSAGNYGPGTSTSVSPANTHNVLSVGAVDENKQVALFSSRGPSACDGELFPRLAAPGVGVMTTDLSFGGMPVYVLVEGTSFAAPHVSGAIALMRGAAPFASVDEIERALTATAHDLGVSGPDQDVGYGLIDVAAAFDVLPPGDLDGDGYGSGRDCNDHDAAVHPGAVERSRDGIDQDCNGFDLTISVKYAVYAHDGSALRLRATSQYGESAALEIVDLGPMTWRAIYGDWIYEGSSGDLSAQIVVRGAEGAVTVKPRATKRRESSIVQPVVGAGS
jgi:bacillopeptidase F